MVRRSAARGRSDGGETYSRDRCFGPFATVNGSDNLDQAIELVARGEGSLVASLFNCDVRGSPTAVPSSHRARITADFESWMPTCARESTGPMAGRFRPVLGAWRDPAQLPAAAKNSGGLRSCFTRCKRTRAGPSHGAAVGA